MEGILWKWTNYWNGWQTRWFVLENGIISYYKSQEEVCQGCKGSVKVSVCQINVNSIDNTRLDIVIPGQQHMYLRAPSPQDRQKWLVALGSAKACVDSKDLKAAALEDTNSLSHKKSELRLYCDLMMQQVHAVKSAATAEGGPETQAIEDASSLLTATCDTFIRTLEDIMRLSSNAGANSAPFEMPIPNITKNNSTVKTPRQSINRTLSQENR
ncbi:pleckstrin homology domain-containing family A member 3 [Helicoverpa armigera]|uniref:pleckstrin homology domain-containing family A member 3 n=1 Tax=Helicoverpa armigera TaxID=29058 RepID=UPI0030834181